jgi:nitrile hydratase subunit beta
VTFTAGDQVRASRVDPPHHTRVPSYARGHVGTVVEFQGSWPLPDDRSRGLPASPQRVYAVRFAAKDLFGAGDHTVILSLWQDYLEPV